MSGGIADGQLKQISREYNCRAAGPVSFKFEIAIQGVNLVCFASKRHPLRLLNDMHDHAIGKQGLSASSLLTSRCQGW